MKKSTAPATTTPAVAEVAAKPAPPPAIGRFEVLARASIHLPEWNPRKNVDQEAIRELAESIARNGFQGTLTVRETTPGQYELVAGQRRLLASEFAGLAEIPCIVATLTDEQAYDVALVENNQRVDLHPLEEAQAFEVKVKRFGRTAEQVAAQIGRSPVYVARRLQLLELCPAGREAFLDEQLSFASALYITRIADPKLQAAVVKDCCGNLASGATALHRDIVWRVNGRMLALAGAPFNTARVDLIPAAGACTSCPHNTGSQRGLFAEDDSPEARCTKPSCYDAKVDAEWMARATSAKERGIEVVSGAAAKKLIPAAYDKQPKGFVRLDEVCRQDTARQPRTYEQLLAGKGKVKAEVKPDLLVRNPHNGQILSLVREKGLKARLKAAGHDLEAAAQEREPTADRGVNAAERERVRQERERQELDRAIEKRRDALLLDRLATVASNRKADRTLWLVLCEMLAFCAVEYLGESDALQTRGIWAVEPSVRGKETEPSKRIVAIFDKLVRLKEPELRGLAFALALEHLGADLTGKGWRGELLMKRLLGWSELDLKELERQAKADATASLKPAKGTTKDRRSVAAGDVDDDDEPAGGDLIAGVCRICRCSEHDACGPTIAGREGDGCAWADATETLCTSCVDHQGETREQTWARIVKVQRLTVHRIVERWQVSLAEVDAVLYPAGSKSKAKKA